MKNKLNIVSALVCSLLTLTVPACKSNAPKHEHVYGEWMTLEEANCKDGKQIRICETCKAVDEKAIPATGIHVYGEPIVIKEATEETEGSQKVVCSTCGHEETQIIPKKDHTHQFVTEIVEPTCEQDGYTKHICPKCGYTFADTFIERVGHSFTDYEVIKEPTCIKNGWKIAHCNNEGCDVVSTIEIIDSDAHEYIEDIDRQIAVCKNCDKESELFIYEYGYLGGPYVKELTDLGNTFEELTIRNIWDASAVKNATKLKKLTLISGEDDSFSHFSCDDITLSIEELIFDYRLYDLSNEVLTSCPNLKKVSFPKGIGYFRTYAFLGCINLETIEFNGSMSEWINIGKEHMWNEDLPFSCVVKCLDGTLNVFEEKF